jgi:hypothetical protein
MNLIAGGSFHSRFWRGRWLSVLSARRGRGAHLPERTAGASYTRAFCGRQLVLQKARREQSQEIDCQDTSNQRSEQTILPPEQQQSEDRQQVVILMLTEFRKTVSHGAGFSIAAGVRITRAVPRSARWAAIAPDSSAHCLPDETMPSVSQRHSARQSGQNDPQKAPDAHQKHG